MGPKLDPIDAGLEEEEDEDDEEEEEDDFEKEVRFSCGVWKYTPFLICWKSRNFLRNDSGCYRFLIFISEQVAETFLRAARGVSGVQQEHVVIEVNSLK
jgi:hypothetical protein